MRYDIPEYSEAMSRFVSSVLAGFAATDPVIGPITVKPTSHAGPFRNVPGASPLDQPMIAFEHVAAFRRDLVRNGLVDEFASELVGMAKEHIAEKQKHFFQTISSISDSAGTSIDARGQPLTFDLILELLENIDLQFEGEKLAGEPVIIMHPDIAKKLLASPPTPEQEQQMNELLSRKRDEFYATKRRRRLSREP